MVKWHADTIGTGLQNGHTARRIKDPKQPAPRPRGFYALHGAGKLRQLCPFSRLGRRAVGTGEESVHFEARKFSLNCGR